MGHSTAWARIRAGGWAVAAVLWAAGTAPAENLLVNGGFEKLDGDIPERWSVFVAPKDGAEGRIDDIALDGRHSVLLHNPEPYEKEPANNWSQNIIEDLAGKTLYVSANIRTRDCTEAAVWLQCFRKHPWGVLRFATTSTDAPMYGTRDWTGVDMKVEVPEGTDFVVIRCVLKGRGTAWFDSLAVDDEARGPDAAGDEAAAADDRAEQALASLREDRDEDAVRRALLDAHKAMVDTNQALRDMNEALARQVEALQAELHELRLQIAGAGAAVPSEPKPAPQAPPLVPHGVDWRRVLP
ncbi:MAG: hypothetical protein JXR94_04845 [Candidatus Hydrogenedentes bacterium]|nr:hypothetical protein [Candidatus Hydrogenedentota bacterium]